MAGAAVIPTRRPELLDGRTLLLRPEVGRLSKDGGQIAVTMPPLRFVDGCAEIFGRATQQSQRDARVDGWA